MEKAKKKKYALVFRCAVPKCTYASQRYYNLQRHKKVHEKMRWRSKRFPCPCCVYAGTTRAHLRRHMGIKHPTVEINPADLKALSFEHFADEERDEEEEEELKQNEQMEQEKELELEEDEEQLNQEEELQLENELQLEHLEQQQKSVQLLINGPVTVLEMVTPRRRESSQILPGEIYSEYTLEGEAFRLIPVALLPPEVAAKDL
ncbi:proline-, glutamic acid- and leucine-rich protein 1 [Drosophila grimshawi]|uniref:GH23125 n=1 Tax=Drosophila grimshawi TaxID=7222 RepID=B4JVH4_DROGR|nr:proline-, glutamic acid- and leucine-rich protein 1 [Drosophila grimshawi]EDV98442.1 GH23125 [Drosophila grimshawi]